MNTEIEAKFIGVDHADIRQKLEQVGATLEKPMRLMKRAIIETPDLRKKDAFVRVRDEGDRTTVTYKQFDSLSIDGAKEIEIVVNNFQDAVALFDAVGLPHKSYQESKRETWHLDQVEVVLDEWPWLDPYIEIEGPTTESVMSAASTLGLKWSEAVFGDVMVAYRAQYPSLTLTDTVADLAEVKFGDPVPKKFR